jgi:hypothetical protein
MYNPFPHLPKKFQSVIISLKMKKIPPGIVFFVIGSLATLWFLVRVIPKPSRAAYPCMQATAPFMSGFVLYLLGIGGAASAFTRFRRSMAGSKYALAMLFLMIAGFLYFLSQTSLPVVSTAGNSRSVTGYFTPNDPFGEAKGIHPGRVVWSWNQGATNGSCTNTSNNNGMIDAGDDAWFMEKNNHQAVIDSMVIKSLMALTGAPDNSGAWDRIFKFYNSQHGKGDVGYSAGEMIFIKINATSAYGGLAGGHLHADLSRTDDLTVNPFMSETNPYLVLSLLKQLVNVAMVPQSMIYIGDPARNIYKEFYDVWHAEFPGIKYLGNDLTHPEINVASLGRTPVVVTTTDKVFFSDHGTVMTDAVTDKLFTVFEEMDYLINIPAMKAHSTAGITLAAKNHFGSFTRVWALHLHKGLMDNYDDPTRLGYGLYRVQTDIMMHNLLSGKNLLILVDGLYPGEDAGGVPEKWTSIPFNNNWCSSLFMSLDPVAIESVCHDFLRTEYNGPTIAESRPNWFGVDDYLHQAADSSRWPDNITYDPDNDGILIASLGVHEHWNDSLHKQYTRNLGTGDGIELFKVHEQGTGTGEADNQMNVSIHPNPACDFVIISNPNKQNLTYSLTTFDGKIILRGRIDREPDTKISLVHYNNGVYLVHLQSSGGKEIFKIIKND